MKKILFASTALVAAGLMTAGTASASEKISLQLGGFSRWWVVGAWQADSYTHANSSSYDNANIKGDNEIWFNGATKLDNGIKVGVDVHLEAGGHTDMTTDTIDKSYVYLEGGFGKFIVGTNKNGTYLLQVQAPDAASNWGEGGILTGNYTIQPPNGKLGKAIGGMAGGNTTAINTTNNAEGLTYVAPTFYGLTVGASYLPHGATEDKRSNVDLNSTSTSTVNQTGDIKQVYGIGALYAHSFGPVGLKVSAGAVTAQTAQIEGTSTDLSHGWFEQSYGANLSYAGFTLGGSWRQQRINQGDVYLGQFGNLTTGSSTGSLANGQAYDLGLKYATGPYAVSFSYFHSGVASSSFTSNVADDHQTFYQLSGAYDLGPGVQLRSSAGYAEYKSAATGDAYSNSGWTLMSGLALTF